MGRQRSAVPGRAWRMLRMALVWASKGGGSSRTRHHGEKELSFDETPLFDFKTHRRHRRQPASMRHLCIPCIMGTAVDLDDHERRLFFKPEPEIQYFLEGDVQDDQDDVIDDCCVGDEDGGCEEEGDEGIDSKADEFIATFYEQMKFQRQVSYLQYNEMLQRGVS